MGEPVLFRARIRNQGDGPATGFWVQLYLNPRTTPYVNSIASQLGTGLFWYVNGLAPGEEITLISSLARQLSRPFGKRYAQCLCIGRCVPHRRRDWARPGIG